MLVATYNVHKCRGTDGVRDPGRVADVMAEMGADLVAVQEADRRLGQRTGLLDLAAIRERAGLRLVPVSDVPGGHGWHGNALLVGEGTVVVGQPRCLELPGTEPRGALVVDLDTPSGAVRVVAAHLGLLPGCRKKQGVALLRAAYRDKPQGTVVILADTNEWRAKSAMSRILHRRFGTVAGAPSFPSRFPLFSLDRIAASWPGRVAQVSAHDTPLARAASDHLPVKARLLLPAAGQPTSSSGKASDFPAFRIASTFEN